MAQVTKTTSQWLDKKYSTAKFYLDLITIFFYLSGFLFVGFVIINFKSPLVIYSGLFLFLIFVAIITKLALWFGKDNIRPFYIGSNAEIEIMEELKKLPGTYWISRDPINYDNGNVDIVVIGPTGVFAVEVKSDKVKLDVKHNRLAYNGLSRHFGKDFVKQTKHGAKKISDHFKSYGPTPYIQPILVFTRAYGLRLGKKKLDGTYIVGKKWLNNIIKENNGFIDQSKIAKLVVNLGH